MWINNPTSYVNQGGNTTEQILDQVRYIPRVTTHDHSLTSLAKLYNFDPSVDPHEYIVSCCIDMRRNKTGGGYMPRAAGSRLLEGNILDIRLAISSRTRYIIVEGHSDCLCMKSASGQVKQDLCPHLRTAEIMRALSLLDEKRPGTPLEDDIAYAHAGIAAKQLAKHPLIREFVKDDDGNGLIEIIPVYLNYETGTLERVDLAILEQAISEARRAKTSPGTIPAYRS